MNGKHFKWLANGVAFGKLVDEQLISSFLLESVLRVNMRPLADPIIFNVPVELQKRGLEPDQDEPEGITGVVVLSTSHCAIHTWPHRGHFVLDVYSCADYDHRIITRSIISTFLPIRVKATDLSHSLDPDGVDVDKLLSCAGEALKMLRRITPAEHHVRVNLEQALKLPVEPGANPQEPHEPISDI